jgi:CRP/FNR family transcriptional regulator, anaerobic regulatory protein
MLSYSASELDQPVPALTGKVACACCCLRELCVPEEFSPCDVDFMRRLVRDKHLKLKRGEQLFRAGERFDRLFAVASGSFKTYLITRDGRERVTGFSFAGDLMGLDAIAISCHVTHAVALENSVVCVLPLRNIEETADRMPLVRRQFQRMLSRELLRSQELTLLLGNLSAEERLAEFLLNLSQRFADRGFSGTRFRLSMSRSDIGRYLAMTPETVSRLFTRLEAVGVIRVRGKAVEIVQPQELETLAGLEPRESVHARTFPPLMQCRDAGPSRVSANRAEKR